MRSFVHELATGRVVFGEGAVEQVPAEVDRLGARRVLLVGGGHATATAGRIAARLGNRLVGRTGEVIEHVPVEVAAAATRQAARAHADLLLSVGGGSAVGLAKAVSRELGVPILAVPSTYAGSEMTPIWGLSEGGRKTTGRDERVLPRTVVYDPLLTLSLPARLTATSGLNALAHCVEARYAPDASPVLRIVAVEGVRALAAALPGCVARPEDRSARAEALYGAWLGGMALGNATMGVHHKLAHVLGGAHRLPHAAVHAALLPYTAAYNRAAAAVAMTDLAAALGAPDGDAPAALWDLAGRIGAPTDLLSTGFRPEWIDAAAATAAAAAPANPAPVTEAGLRHLLAAACTGRRPTRAVPAEAIPGRKGAP
ncbi:MAG: maleylacetate reductase [Mycobacteriales bacterium]